MMKDLLGNKFVHMVAALLISIGFWAYVVVGTNPDCTANLNVSNVVCEGLSELTDKGFFFIGAPPEKVEVKVRGPWKLVTKDSDEYKATIDFTEIKGAGDYKLKVKVVGPGGVEIKNVKPNAINVTIDAGKKKTVPASLAIYGKKGENFEVELIDDMITVSGPTASISKIKEFKVEINADGIEKTGKVMHKAIPLDENGVEVVDKELTYDKSVYVQIDRIKKADVVVDESLIPAYIKEIYNVSVEYDPKTVRIAGEDAELEAVGKIEADLSTVMLKPGTTPQKAEIKVIVPENVRLAKNESETVAISIKYEAVNERN